MPEAPNPKLREPPPPGFTGVAPSAHAYAELDVTTNFTFLCGASHADELVYRAAELGYRAIAVTDVNSLAGVVRMHEAAKEVGLPLLVGSRLVFTDAPDLLVWASDRASYAALCRLLTLGKRRTEKGECTLHLEDFLDDNQGLHAAVVAPADLSLLQRSTFQLHQDEVAHPFVGAGSPGLIRAATVRERGASNGQSERNSTAPLPYGRGSDKTTDLAYRKIWERSPEDPTTLSFPRGVAHERLNPIKALHEVLGDRLSLAVSCGYGPDDAARLAAVAQLSDHFGVPMLATNAVHYHDPARRQLQDVLTCVKDGCTIASAGFRLFANGERYLKSPEQMHRLFVAYPQALRRGLQIADACKFQLDSLRYEYPDELAPPGMSSIQYLRHLTETGAAERYPKGIYPHVRELIEHELKLIEQLKFEAYFLTVYDLVRFARSKGILCQGRGSAANSAVCYCIGVTSVDPARVDLLFERFISAARNEPPDIDVDFEHERREEVIQYIYTKYGRERAGMTAEVITYRGRSAVRDVGKAMGLSLDMVDSMASKLDWWHRGLLSEPQIRECGLDPDDANVRRVIALATELLGFPRHLSQHVGGMVMTRGPLCEMVPIENAAMADRTVIEWDKDDIDSLGILKVDALALGMLTCISKAFGLIEQAASGRSPNGATSYAKREPDTIPPLSMPAEEWQSDATSTAMPYSAMKPLSPSPGTPGEGRGEGSSSALFEGEEDPHPHPEYQERGQEERWAVPTLHGAAISCRVGTDHRLSSTAGDYIGSEDAGRQARVPTRLSLHTIPPADAQVYDMICDADTVGVFQIESRAQMSMLPRLRPRCFYDLVIEVAIVRPGPIQGNMVHPYLRRRSGDEPVSFPSEALRHVLEKTLGVPLFQEQAMRIAMVAAGFTADEADKLRRVMAAWRRSGAIETFHRKIVEGMVGNGYTREFAEQCFNQIKGFGEYGFPESHAASFALLVYVSAWLKRHHPAAFAAALINSQPMGFYMPAQIVRDAQDHGVRVLPADVNESDWDCTLEPVEENGGQCPPYTSASPCRVGTAHHSPCTPESIAAIANDDENGGQCPSYVDAAPNSVDAAPNSPDASVPTCRVGTAHRLSASLSLPKSQWGARGPQLRLGLRQLKGFKEACARQIETERQRNGRFTSIEQLQQRASLPTSALRILAEADAFGSLGLSRRQALWQVMELKDASTPLFDQDSSDTSFFRAATIRERIFAEAHDPRHSPLPDGRGSENTSTGEGSETASVALNLPLPDELGRVRSSGRGSEKTSPDTLFPQPTTAEPALPLMPLGQEVMTDYATAGLSLKQHPVALIRDQLRAKRIITSAELGELPDGRWVKVAGLVLMRQRPGTASGIVFETLEDETGIINLIVKPDIYDRYRPAARHAGLLQADGYLQRQGDVIHILPKRMIDLSSMIEGYELRSRDFH